MLTPLSSTFRWCFERTSLLALQHKLIREIYHTSIPETTTATNSRVRILLWRRTDDEQKHILRQIYGRKSLHAESPNKQSTRFIGEQSPMYPCVEKYAVEITQTTAQTYRTSQPKSKKISNFPQKFTVDEPHPPPKCCLFPTYSPPTQKCRSESDGSPHLNLLPLNGSLLKLVCARDVAPVHYVLKRAQLHGKT